MSREDIIKKAKIIVIPHTHPNGNKQDYSEILSTHEHVSFDESDYVVDRDLFIEDSKNSHHLIPKWHYTHSMIAIDKLLNFGYNSYDFYLIDDGKYSFMVPKIKQTYKITHPYVYVTKYTNEFQYEWQMHYKYYTFSSNEITSCNEILPSHKGDEYIWGSKYHHLFKYPHDCVTIENETNTNGSDRTLLISGDSHMIPNIPILLYYFKKVIVLDNRFQGLSFYNWLNIENENITDVLFELWIDSFEGKVTKINLL